MCKGVKGRYIIENLNTWIKNYKRILNRYDKNALNYEQIIYSVINNIILNKSKDLSIIDYEPKPASTQKYKNIYKYNIIFINTFTIKIKLSFTNIRLLIPESLYLFFLFN